MLSHGGRNRMSTSLEKSVRLKLNAKALDELWTFDWVLSSRLAIWVNVDSCIMHVSTAIVLVRRWLCSNTVDDKTVTEMM